MGALAAFVLASIGFVIVVVLAVGINAIDRIWG